MSRCLGAADLICFGDQSCNCKMCFYGINPRTFELNFLLDCRQRIIFTLNGRKLEVMCTLSLWLALQARLIITVSNV